MTASMWKNEHAAQRMREWHERFRAQISTTTSTRTVSTSEGETHVLMGGPKDAPPVVLLHGAMASSAHMLLELEALCAHHRVYSVDILGQSAMSADVRPSVLDDSTGHWLREVLDALALPCPAVVGVSWGGFVAQRLAAVAPERIQSLVLITPAGMVSGPRWRGFVEMGWPMTRYLLAPSPKHCDALLRGLLTTPDDSLWAPFLAEAFLAANLRTMKVPKLSREGEFARLSCPVHVIGAERDVSFPGGLVVARAKALFPTLSSARVLEETRHSPPTTREFRARFGAEVSALLAREPQGPN
jgi:pimeloyl-ACP methyl ester carboxylesterase